MKKLKTQEAPITCSSVVVEDLTKTPHVRRGAHFPFFNLNKERAKVGHLHAKTSLLDTAPETTIHS